MIHPNSPIEEIEELVEIRGRKVHDAIDRTRAAQNELNSAIADERMAHYDLAEARTILYTRKGMIRGAVESAQQIMADYTNEFGGTTS